MERGDEAGGSETALPIIPAQFCGATVAKIAKIAKIATVAFLAKRLP